MDPREKAPSMSNSTRRGRIPKPAVNGRDRPVEQDLDRAHKLADMGVPVFRARLGADSQPVPPRAWQQTKAGQASHDAIDAWRPGDALCAVTGVVFDVVDWDPRNDPDERSFEKLVSALGDDGPEKYWGVKTPRGGSHLWIATLDLGSHNGFMPGLDLKGGHSDGSGRGFVFLPPTERYGIRYKPTTLLGSSPNGHSSIAAITEYIGQCLDTPSLNGSSGGGNGHSGGRQPVSVLTAEVLAAEPGGQRSALLRLVQEYERLGRSRDEIIAELRGLTSSPGFRNFDGRKPWYPARGNDPDKNIKSLFHRSGAVVPDGTAEELEGIDEPRRPHGLRSFAEVTNRLLDWIIPGFLARQEFTVIDGETNVGKTIVVLDLASRLSNGQPMPWDELSAGEVVKTVIYTSEASAEVEIGPRLQASGANVHNVFTQKVEAPVQPKRGQAKPPEPKYSLPSGAGNFGYDISAVGAGICVLDPVNEFFDSTVDPNKDIEVRAGLGPFLAQLRKNNAAGILIRHLNKNTNGPARMRGLGTTAYQNMARVHVVAGRLPEGSHPEFPQARFGLAIVGSNLRKFTDKRSLAYDIVDSDVQLDGHGGMAAKIRWYGWVNVSADDLTKDSEKRPGRIPMAREEVREVLTEMFARRDTWASKECLAELADAGCSTDKKVLAKAREELGIRTQPRRGDRIEEHGEGSDWTTVPRKYRTGG